MFLCHVVLFDYIFHSVISKKDMDFNEHERLSNITLKTQIKVKVQRGYWFATLHSDSSVFNNEHSSYPNMCVKRLLSL